MEIAARHAHDWEESCFPGYLWLPRFQTEVASPFPAHKRGKIKKPSPNHKRSVANAETKTGEKAERAAVPLSILRLVNLLDGNEDGEKEDDYGAIIPSMFAFETALGLVRGAIKILGEDVVSSSVVDSQGGIRTTWKRGGRQVKLICPATREAPLYIYQSSDTGNSVQNQNITAEALAARLSVLIGREPTATR